MQELNRELRRGAGELDRRGVELKDPEKGLIDFFMTTMASRVPVLSTGGGANPVLARAAGGVRGAAASVGDVGRIGVGGGDRACDGYNPPTTE